MHFGVGDLRKHAPSATRNADWRTHPARPRRAKKLASRDHLAHLRKRCCADMRHWSMFKEYREEAYKQNPHGPRDQPYATIALRGPKTGRWRGWHSRALVFGATGDLLRRKAYLGFGNPSPTRCRPHRRYSSLAISRVTPHPHPPLPSYRRNCAIILTPPGSHLEMEKFDLGADVNVRGFRGRFQYLGGSY